MHSVNNRANVVKDRVLTLFTSVPFLLTLCIWLSWVLWLFQYPLVVSSDDALFFSRGVDRFSVIEFSPHFPGYPAFIALASLLYLLAVLLIALHPTF